MRRALGKKTSVFVNITLFLMALYNIYTFTRGTYDIFEHMFINLIFVLPLIFVLYPAFKKDIHKIPWYDYILILTSFAVTIAFWYNYYSWIFSRAWLVSPLTTEQIMIGIVLIILFLEAIRRCFGKVLTILCLVFLIYGILAPYLPYPLGFRTTFQKIIDLLCFSPFGIFSSPLQTMVSYVIPFTLLGAVYVLSGVGDFFIDLAKSLVGRSTGGVAKVAVISSSLFGTISGSAVANVYATGTLTIPTMIGLNYPARFAAAVEAVASTGGQIMPPILGAAAFVMAEILEVPYAKIMIAALIPALLYYLSVFIQVHFYSKKIGLRGLSGEEVPKLSTVLKTRGYCLLPLIVFLYTLLGLSWRPTSAAIASLYTALGLSLLKKDARKNPLNIARALVQGAYDAISIIIAAAGAGIIVGVMSYTGIALKAGYFVMSASFGITLLALIYVALFSIILGMGLPTTPAYIMASAISVPALSLLGIKGFTAHFFVLYYAACAAPITPPVALAAYAAASIAKESPMNVGTQAVKLGIAALIVPFAFAFKPELLLTTTSTSLGNLLWSSSMAFIAITSIALSLEGYIKQKMRIFERLGLIVAGLGLIFLSSLTFEVFCLALISVILAIHLKLPTTKS